MTGWKPEERPLAPVAENGRPAGTDRWGTRSHVVLNPPLEHGPMPEFGSTAAYAGAPAPIRRSSRALA